MPKRGATLALLLLASCSHSAGPAPSPSASHAATAGSAEVPATASSDAVTGAQVESAPSSSSEAANLPFPPREAVRRTLTRLDGERLVAAQTKLVSEHFGGAVPPALEVQSIPLPGDHRAFLTYVATPPAKPLLFVTSGKAELLWTKERPLAGTRQIVTEMVLAPGPSGEVALLWCDIPTQIVGLRKWDSAGVVLADFEVLEVDLCEALAALYWPGRGWIAVASQTGAARAQMLDERGARAWGLKGLALPWTARPSAPAALAVDSDATAMVFQVGDRPKAGSVVPDRVLAMRYDLHGVPLWDAPIDLGPAPGASPTARLAATTVEPGKVRVAVGGPTRGRPATVTITSEGGILER